MKIKLLLMTTLLAVMLGCKDNNPEPERELIFNVLQTELSFSDEVGSKDIDVMSNAEWTLTGTTDWCTASVSSGQGEQKIKVSVSANSSYDGRSTQLVFSCGGISKNVAIHQSSKGALMITDKMRFTGTAEGVVTIELRHNTEGYDVLLPNKEAWLSLLPTKAMVSETISFKVEAHSGDDNRSAMVVIKDKQTSIADTATIWQVVDNSLILTQRTHNLDSNGGTIEAIVKEDVNIEVPKDADWLSVSQVVGIGTRKLIIKVNKSEYDNRSTTILVKDKNSAQQSELVINQSHTNAIILLKKIYTIPAIGSDINVVVQSNLTYNVTIPSSATWVKQVATKGLVTSVLHFTIDALPADTEIRETDIYIEDAVTKTCDTLNVRQITGSFVMNVKTPGTLKDIMTYDEMLATISLVVTGDINDVDIVTISDSMPLVKYIDLSGANLARIPKDAFFWRTSINSIVLPETVTSIGYQAFTGCSSLTSINIPAGVTSIGRRAFRDCSSLTSINIPKTVTSIEERVFAGCSSLTSINIPAGVTSIEDMAFSGCSSLTSINIPAGVTSMGSSAFAGCSSLTSINIAAGVTLIGVQAFSGCSSLTSINIPETVTSIGFNAFRDCSSLTDITCKVLIPPTVDNGTFYQTPKSKILKVPAGSVDAYKANSSWNAIFNSGNNIISL